MHSRMLMGLWAVTLVLSHLGCLVVATAGASLEEQTLLHGEVGSAKSLRQRSVQQADPPREAVLFQVQKLDSLCISQSLMALVKSSSSPQGPKRDVWYVFDPETPPQANGPLMRELLAAGLKVEKCEMYPTNDCWNTFAEPSMAGVSKGCSLNFARRHSEYDRFWFVEEDTFFTGKWHTFFDAQMQNNADIFAKLDTDALRAKDEWKPTLNVRNCVTKGGHCWGRDGMTTRAMWFLLRASRRFLTELADSTDRNETCAHHEISSMFCAMSDWCTLSHIPENLHGYFWPGHYGAFVDGKWATWKRMLEVSDMEEKMTPNLAFHPVKCWADDLRGLIAMAYAEASC